MNRTPTIQVLATDQAGRKVELLTDEEGHLLMIGNQAIKIDRAGLRLLAQALTKAIQQTKSSDGATGLKSDRR